MATRYAIIGAGLAGGEAAKQIRERDPEGRIVLIGQEPHRPYDRPPLSKEYLRGQKPREQLYFDPEGLFTERRIELHLGATVTALNLDDKTIRYADGRTLAFDKALLATGGRPVRLSLPGSGLPGVHYLRTIEDADAIIADGTAGRRAVIIGAGFIGLELAASLTQRGVAVTVMEAEARIWPRFAAPELARFVQEFCAKKGVEFVTGERATAFDGTERVRAVVTASGRVLPCDFVCIGVGIVPNVELAQAAGLNVDRAVVVDEFLQTSHPDVYAAGDLVTFPDPYAGRRRRVEHWGHAEYSGQLAGRNMTGERAPYDLLSYVWSDLFELHLEFAGDEHGADRIVTRGALEEGRFVMLALRAHRLTAYFAVNAPAKDLPTLQRLIRQRVDLSGKLPQLQDPAVPLKSLLA